MSGTVHVNRGTNNRYAAVVRAYGRRTWRPIGHPTRSERIAVRRLLDAMTGGHAWKQGRLLFVSDFYSPTIILKIDK